MQYIILAAQLLILLDLSVMYLILKVELTIVRDEPNYWLVTGNSRFLP